MRVVWRGANLSQIYPDGDVNISGMKINGYVKFAVQAYVTSGTPMILHTGDPGTAMSGKAVKYACAGDNSGQFYLG